MSSSLPHVNVPFVLTKCDYFVDVQIWPLRQYCNPKGWLSNFLESEQTYGVHLLNSFMFFRQSVMDQLMASAFQGISRRLCQGQAFATAQTTWRGFMDSLLVTRVTGETPNDTDSGYQFARLARQVLDISQERIVSPTECVEAILKTPRPVVFVDDFAGSGDQFATTWHRAIVLPGGMSTSFERVARVRRGVDFYYCPLLCTETAAKRIASTCARVIVAPAHLLPSSYSAVSPDSILWPPSMRADGIRFIEEASKRAGIPHDEWRGYADLGLALAFEHYAVPDATLPLFYWEENGWIPLVPRR